MKRENVKKTFDWKPPGRRISGRSGRKRLTNDAMRNITEWMI